jgi:hypothetical protein
MKKSLLVLTGIVALWFAYQQMPSSSTASSTAVPADVLDAGSHAVASQLSVPVAVAVSDAVGTMQLEFSQILAFSKWTEKWLAAAAEDRPALVAEGRSLAEVRRPALKKLIVRDPQRALENAVSRVVRQSLPKEITDELERPVSAQGVYNVYFGKPLPGAELPSDTELTMRYFETLDGDSFKARVFGAMLPVLSNPSLPLRGVAIDREFAVAESPVRKLEVGEMIPADTVVSNTCPVSGKTTVELTPVSEPVSEETPVVEVGGRLITLCNGAHVSVMEESYREASGAGGAGAFKDAYPGTSSNAIGNFRCLYIRVTYTDQLKAPNTEASGYSDMRNVARYYLDSSFGRMSETATVTPLIVLPHSQAWYIAKDSEVDGLGLVHSDARSEAKKLGYDSGQYTCTIVRVNGGPRLSGISWGGGSSVWVSWDGMDVLNHECGHSLGRNHANYWATTDGTAIGNGANQEYGNSFDVMGGGGGFGAHYNTISKRALGWLSDPYIYRPVATAVANGTYRLTAYDQPTLEEGKRYALRVAKDSAREYYVEYHPAGGTALKEEAMLLFKWSGMSNAGHLIDTTPGSAGGKSDGGIQVGRTFSDAEADLHFTVLSKNATVPPSLDLSMQRGPFVGNLPPTVSVSASATAVAVGANITFTATASDPNGDPLSYHWEFNDGVVSQNIPVLTRNFPATDQMTVMVTASDMKGGTARAHVVVTIGNPGRSIVTGQIMAGAQPLMGVYVTSENGKYCFTDSAGNYAVSDLTQASHTLSATLAGYTFTSGFTNPFTPTTGTNPGKDWTTVSVPELTMTATAHAVEGGANGSFVLTRTGDTTNALDVHIASPTGNATITTDYTLSPAYTDDGVFKKLSFPAGASSLTVDVVPVNDTSAEGPEIVTLQYAANPGYIVRSLGSATVNLADNDTTLPQVKLTAPDPYATEEPGDAAAFTISRTGSTTAALNVTLAFTGTATRGTDYPSLPTTFTIPANAASAPLVLTPTDDAAIEIPEDVIVTISTNAAYVIESGGNTATATITDDDTPVVTIATLDAVAMEAGRDPGVLLVSRTGTTAAALKVYYGVSGSALHGTDYVALSGEITIPAGMASAPLLITPYDDNFGEPMESVTINLTTFGDAYSMAPAFSATVNIQDNNDPPLVNVTAGTTAAEPSTNGTFVIRTIGSNAAPVTVRFAVSGTATSGTDFTARSGVVTLAGDGSASSTVSIPMINDALPEDTETVIITLLPDPSYVIYNDGTAIVRVKDDDSVAVSVSTHSATPAEPATVSSFYLARTNSTGDLTVNYTLSGTASNGADYDLLPGLAVIPDGQTGVDVTITPINDTLAEGTETITLTIAAGPGYGFEVPSATLYLTDNETNPVTVGWTLATATTTEALDPTLGEFRDVTVTLSAAQATDVTVEFTAGGGTTMGDDVDWAFVDATNGNAVIPRGIVTFAPGQTVRNVRIKIKNDSVREGSETAILQLRNPNGAALTTGKNLNTLTISDANDLAPRVQFLLANSTVAEADGKEPMLMAVLDQSATSLITVNYSVTGGTATSGSDFTLPPGTLTFAVGETFKPLPLTIVVDAVPELAETIIVSLTNPAQAALGTQLTHTITVKETNISNLSVIASTEEAVEGGQSGAFTISRSGGSTALALTVNYTLGGNAANGVDYTNVSGSVVLSAGQTSVSVPVVPIDDNETEPVETVILTLVANANYNLGTEVVATVNLLDNDAPPVITIISPTTDSASLPLGVGLMVHAESSRTAPTGVTQVPVTWSMVSGPGTAVFESPDTNQTGITFPSAGTYVLRVTSGNPTGLSTADLTVFYDAPALTGQDIAAVAATTAGSWTSAAGAYTVKASGLGISGSGTADGFYFVSIPVTGNFDFKVRIASILNPGGEDSCRFGLMARASNAANALYAFSFHRSNGLHGFQYRTTAGVAPGSSVSTTVYTMPRWVRLTRTGDVFAAYHSADGTTWTQRGANQTVAIGASPLVGFALTSAVQASLSTAVFDSANLPLATNTGPFVNAGNALSGLAPWNLDATLTDDGQPLPASLTHNWTTFNGPGNAAFTAASAIDTGVTLPVSGLYTLRLTASDGAITTFDDTTVNATVPLPIETWRTAKFTTNTGNPAISGDLADPDHDGITNLLEYGLNLDPNTHSTQLPTIGVEGDTISLTYRKNLAATDITMEVEESTNMSTWTPADVTETILSTSGNTQTIKASLPADGQRHFLHLKVTYGGTTPPQP